MLVIRCLGAVEARLECSTTTVVWMLDIVLKRVGQILKVRRDESLLAFVLVRVPHERIRCGSVGDPRRNVFHPRIPPLPPKSVGARLARNARIATGLVDSK